MMIYDFVSKVQAEYEASRKLEASEHAAQNHNRGRDAGIRARVLWEVLTWAGFEGCTITKVKETP